MKDLKIIVITGGVLSGLGKGIVSASVGRLLPAGLKVIPIKCDGYLNVDPGTMNPYEHGEVFVLDDGGEVDLDFGHYERFLDINTKFGWNLTSGKIFKTVIDNERRGDYLGKTVQMIPHVTDEIKKRFFDIADKENADVLLIEMGGTVGDIEMMLFNEAARQLRLDLGFDNVMYIHLTYVPELSCVGEQKTKPTQQSTEILRKIGIQPDVLIGRSSRILDEKSREKMALFANLSKSQVISDPDISTVYELPLIFMDEGLHEIILKKFSFDEVDNLKNWSYLVESIKNSDKEVNIAICGKYTGLHDSYLSISEALSHAGANAGVNVKIKWIETGDIETGIVSVEDVLKSVDGVIVPGGFGSRGTEGKIKIINYVRENKIPFLGICLGFQLAVIEFARNVCGLSGANSSEFDKDCKFSVIDLLPEQRKVKEKGGTMRLGGHDVLIVEGTKAYSLFGANKIRRRFRHRYEVNQDYLENLIGGGMIFSGMTPDKSIMQVLELFNHPYFIGSQFHPELTSRLERPSDLFLGLLQAALRNK